MWRTPPHSPGSLSFAMTVSDRMERLVRAATRRPALTLAIVAVLALGGGALALLRVSGEQASGHFASFFGGFMPTRTITTVPMGDAFGLVAVDRQTFARTPKPSLAWLGEVARRTGLPG